MKPIYNTLLTSGVVATLTACSGLRLSGDYALSDDVYFDNSATRAVATAPATPPAVSQSDIASYDRRVAAYSNNSRMTPDSRDFSQIQRYYSNANATNGAAADTAAGQPANRVKVTEVSPDNPDSGYWLDGFNGSDADQSYAERIIKFHRPIVSVNYYSPFFDCARYSGDWNIYIDGYGSAYFVPTWSNPWYGDYYYGGLAYDWRWRRLGWHLGWGYGGWRWGFGWTSGWGYYDWAWGGWGWPHYHRPYHHGWWGAPHHPHHWAPNGGLDAPRRPVYASRAGVMPQTHSGSRQEGQTTTNPNASRAAQLYRNSYATPGRVSRSYTRNTDGSPTLPSRNSAYGTNVRRPATSGSVAGGAASSSSLRTPSSYSTNTRRSTSAINGSSSRASYTPSNGRTSRSSSATSVNRNASAYSSNVRRSTSTSTYAPSGSQRQSGSTSSYTPRGAARSSGSFSGGATNTRRTAPASSFSGGGRSGGSSYSSAPRSSGGGGARTARPR